MNVYEMLNKVEADCGISQKEHSRRANRSPQFISASKSRGGNLTAETVAMLLNAIGYSLVAVPTEAVDGYRFTADSETLGARGYIITEKGRR